MEERTPRLEREWRQIAHRVAPAAVAALVALASVGGGVAGSAATVVWMTNHAAPPAIAAPATPTGGRQVGIGLSTSNIATIYEAVSPTIVSVMAVTTSSRSSRSVPQGASAGTGIIVSDQGYILTNNHVVQDANKLTVTLLDGTTVDATIAGTDPGSDLAVLKADIPKEKIVVATLGDSDRVEPGEPAIAVGNPFGLDHTVTSGIISAVNREYGTANGRPMRGLIQTDAPINPGNSGGPLFNDQGEVIGITTSIESPVQGSVGIGFAIPVNRAKQLLPELQSGKRVEHTYLGIQGGAIGNLATTHQFPVDSGVLVVKVEPNGPAAKAGLKGGDLSTSDIPVGGDIITEVDGTAVKTVPEISGYIDTKAVGDVVTLTVIRDGKTMRIAVTLGAWPASSRS
ncbi:MAG: trypsin-like peptidase domain-containing protein [Chloroflexota bacterium]